MSPSVVPPDPVPPDPVPRDPVPPDHDPPGAVDPGALVPGGARGTSRALVVSRRGDLVDDVLRLAAASGVDVEVAPDVVAARPAWPSAPLVLVDDDPATTEGLARLPRRPGVVLVGTDADDASVWRRAVTFGAEHVVFLPESEPWLVERFADARDGATVPARVLAVVGGSGGVGATTLSSALAVAAVGRRHRTLLVDLDPLGGGIDLALGGEAEAGLRWPDLARARGRLNGTSLTEALPRVGELSVLSWDRGADVEVPFDAARAVLDAMVRVCDVVVADLPRTGRPAAAHVAGRADELVVVVGSDVRAVASADRVLRTYRPLAGSVRAVVRGPSSDGLSAADVCTALSVDLAGELVAEPRVARDNRRGEPPGRRRRGPLATLCAELLDAVEAVPVRAYR